MIKSTQAWFLHPPHWALVEKCLTLSVQSLGPVAKRPTHGYYGDEIEVMQMAGDIGIVPVNGPLVKGATGSDKKSGLSSYDDVADDMDAAVAAGARAIVLKISSPGGGVIGAGELARHVADIQESGTPVVSFTDSMQCSAAEFLSGACELRLATSDAIVGSIGTILTTVSIEGLLGKAGIKAAVFTSGQFKGAGHPLKDLTDEQSNYLQSFVDNAASEFKGWMVKHRGGLGLTDDSMQGQIFTGKQGKAIGLIDGTVPNLKSALRVVEALRHK